MPGDQYTYEINAEDEASAPINNVGENLEKLGDEAELTQEDAQSLADGVEQMAQRLSAAESEIKDLREELDDLENEAEETREEVDGLGTAAGAVGGAVAGFGAAVGAAAVKVGSMAVQTSRSVAEMKRASEATGVAAEEYQKLKFAMRKAGGDAQMLKEALATVAERAIDAKMGAKGVREDFASIGITVDDLQNKGPGELFNMLASRIRNAESESRALKGAVSLLGDEVGNKLVSRIRSGEQGLDALRQQAEELDVVLSKSQINALDRADQAAERATTSYAGLRRTIAAEFAPAVQAASSDLVDMAKALQKPETQETIEDLAQFSAGLIEAADATGKLYTETVQLADSRMFKGALSGVARSLTGGMSDSLIQVANNIKAAGAAAEREQKKIAAFDEKIKKMRDSVGAGPNALAGEVDRLRRLFLKYGEDSTLVQSQLANFEKQLADVASQAEDTSAAMDSATIGKDMSLGAGFAKAKSVSKKELKAFERIQQNRVDIQRTKLRLARSENDVQKANLRKQLGLLRAEQTRLKAQSKSLSKEERRTKELKAQTQAAKARKRHEKRLREIQRQDAKSKGSSAAQGAASTAKSTAASMVPPTASGRGQSVGKILGIAQAKKRAATADALQRDKVGRILGTATDFEGATRTMKRNQRRNEQRARMARRTRKVSQGFQGLGQAGSQASQLARAMGKTNEELAQTVEHMGAVGDQTGKLIKSFSKVANSAQGSAKAMKASASAVEGLGGVGAQFANAFIESEKKRAKVKAGIEAAQAAAMIGLSIANPVQAPQFLASAAQHTAAAAMFGAVAGGASGGGGGGGTPSAGGGGGGGGASGPSLGTADTNFNPRKQRQKAFEGMAKALEQQQQNRPINISVDARGAALPSRNPQFIDDVKKGLDQASRNTISP